MNTQALQSSLLKQTDMKGAAVCSSLVLPSVRAATHINWRQVQVPKSMGCHFTLNCSPQVLAKQPSPCLRTLISTTKPLLSEAGLHQGTEVLQAM